MSNIRFVFIALLLLSCEPMLDPEFESYKYMYGSNLSSFMTGAIKTSDHGYLMFGVNVSSTQTSPQGQEIAALTVIKTSSTGRQLWSRVIGVHELKFNNNETYADLGFDSLQVVTIVQMFSAVELNDGRFYLTGFMKQPNVLDTNAPGFIILDKNGFYLTHGTFNNIEDDPMYQYERTVRFNPSVYKVPNSDDLIIAMNRRSFNPNFVVNSRSHSLIRIDPDQPETPIWIGDIYKNNSSATTLTFDHNSDIILTGRTFDSITCQEVFVQRIDVTTGILKNSKVLTNGEYEGEGTILSIENGFVLQVLRSTCGALSGGPNSDTGGIRVLSKEFGMNTFVDLTGPQLAGYNPSLIRTQDGGYAVAYAYSNGGIFGTLIVKTNANYEREWEYRMDRIQLTEWNSLLQANDGGIVFTGSEVVDGSNFRWTMLKLRPDGTL